MSDLPATRNPVEGSEHQELIHQMLCSDWHPWRVAAEIERQYGVSYAPEDIKAYLATIPDEELLPAGRLRRHFQNKQVISDPLMELHTLLRFSRERLEAAIDREEAEGKELSPEVQNYLQQHWERAIQFQEIVERIQPPVQYNPLPRQEGPTLRDLYERMNPRRVTMREVTIDETDE